MRIEELSRMVGRYNAQQAESAALTLRPMAGDAVGVLAAFESLEEAEKQKLLSALAPRVATAAASAVAPKARFELIPAAAEREVAAVFTHGVAKHGERAWTDGAVVEDVELGAALRHINAHRRGETHDDSGLLHLAHGAARLMKMCEGLLGGFLVRP